MKTQLQHITIKNFKTQSGEIIDLSLSYQTFGKELHTAPIIVVNHALTGNSEVAGEKGWWKMLIGKDKPIDTEKFTILCFNIPGNGYDGFFLENYENFTAKDIAKIFLLGLENLQISQIKMLIGGSLGGCVAWEMLGLKPDLAEIFVPIATDYKTTDWLHSQCLVQTFLLDSEDRGLQKARIHAMLFYRSPQSLNLRFKKEWDEEKGLLKSHDWLNYHGRALDQRFDIRAYRLMNHLLMGVETKEEDLKRIEANIHFVAVDTDWLFPAFEMENCYLSLKENQQKVHYHEIKSIHGHDAFLMEYEQLEEIFKEII